VNLSFPSRRAPAALVVCSIAVLMCVGFTACGSTSPQATSATPSATTTSKAGSLPGTGRPLVTIGDKNFTEQFVLG